MKKALLGLALLLPLAGCETGIRIVSGEGEVVETTFFLEDVSAVSVRHLLGSKGNETLPLSVSFYPGDEAKAVLRTQESLFEEFTHVQKGDSFSLEGKQNVAYKTEEFSLSFYGVSPNKIVGESVKILDEGALTALREVHLSNVGALFLSSTSSPSLSVKVENASSFQAEGVATTVLEAEVRDASSFFVDSLACPDASFQIEAASKANIAGLGNKLKVEARNASGFYGEGFPVSETRIEVASSSGAEVRAQKASGKVKSASFLTLFGCSSDSFEVDDSSSLAKKS
ncbi:MAG: DUF2807 domain-containing protein [Bacillales bacterium]|nr:DUF2807 domain-containing protein [Bacillales bacterium]MDY5920413.1 DUF2807 domain-containing protein [Candidatus Enteromonas sp.]